MNNIEESQKNEVNKKGIAIRVLLILICLVLGSMTVIFKPIEVEGSSMENTLLRGDYLYTKRYFSDSPKRFDIVIIKTDRSMGLHGSTIVKRIIGTPGDKVEISGGDLFVNGNKIQENYVNGKTTQSLSVQLSGDEYFVIGDNRTKSLDSRMFGPVKRSKIVSKAVIRLFPTERYGTVR